MKTASLGLSQRQDSYIPMENATEFNSGTPPWSLPKNGWPDAETYLQIHLRTQASMCK